MVDSGTLNRTAALELRNITKLFGDFVADSDVSLQIEQGEVHALVGENGAGKTTLMNICFGILQPRPATSWSTATPSPCRARRALASSVSAWSTSTSSWSRR